MNPLIPAAAALSLLMTHMATADPQKRNTVIRKPPTQVVQSAPLDASAVQPEQSIALAPSTPVRKAGPNGPRTRKRD